jgi:hypothetical protein
MKRIYVNVTDVQAEVLKERAATTGVPQAAQIRMALEAALVVPMRRSDVERFTAQRTQPVLVATKAGE